jgi:4-hydroxy-2-oxoglutarate aldolase
VSSEKTPSCFSLLIVRSKLLADSATCYSRHMSVSFRGIYAPVVTPFRDQRLDLDALTHNLSRYSATPLAGLVVLGSNGEAPFLDDEESDAVLRAARAAISSRLTFIAGTGRESTAATIAATRRAADLGADAALVRTPSFYKGRMGTEAYVRHYEAVADASPIPLLLYNVTVFTGVQLPSDAVAALSRHERIAGLKDSNPDLALLADFLAKAPPPFSVLSGSAPTLYPSFAIGAPGAVVAIAGLVPDMVVRLFDLVQQGAHAEAAELQRRLTPLAQAVGSRFGVPGLKAALDLHGYRGGEPRLPLLPAPPEALAAIRAHLDALHAHA